MRVRDSCRDCKHCILLVESAKRQGNNTSVMKCYNYPGGYPQGESRNLITCGDFENKSPSLDEILGLI